MHRDPVARSIRNEQMRDAAPTAEEQAEMKRKFLEDNGCEFCGESDVENLNANRMIINSCRQDMHMCEVVYCDECGFDADFYTRWKRIEQNRRNDVAVIYECGSTQGVDVPEPETTTVKKQVGRDQNGDPVYEEVEQKIPTRTDPTPDIPAWCPKCGEGIESVVKLE